MYPGLPDCPVMSIIAGSDTHQLTGWLSNKKPAIIY
jgi:hypothetical protein